MTLVMSLKIKGIIRWSIWGVVGLLFLFFLIRVAVFEANYYNDKEGTERAVAAERSEVQEEEEELIEVEPTEQEVREYTVAADRPRYLTIKKIGVNRTRVLAMGVNSKGELDTPRNIYDVGWYESSGKPGQGGTLIIDGHNGGPHAYGILKRLPDLAVGDLVTVERGDGAIYNYSVVENVEVALDQANAYMSTAAQSPESGRESLTLISCTGEWSQQQETYLSRQFARAVLVEE